MTTDDRRFQSFPGPRELGGDLGGEMGDDDGHGLTGHGREPGPDLGMPPLNQNRENPAERSFLGGIRVRTRLSLFFLLCLAALCGTGALFYVADRKLDTALSQMRDAGGVAGLIAKIEASTLAIHSDSRNFLLSKDTRYAGNYKKRVEVLARHLKDLHDMPAALDGQKLVTTLNDGVTQHAGQFLNVVKIQTLLGGSSGDSGGGLIGNAAATASDLQKMFKKIGKSGLTAQMAKLRASETRLQQAPEEAEIKKFKSGITELNGMVGRTDLPNAQKNSLLGIVKSYQSDVEQFSRTQSILAKEITRLGEINTYLSPNLESLITFAANLSKSAGNAANSVQIEIRRWLVGGGGGILLLVLLMGYLLMRSVTKPVEKIAVAANQLAHGDSSAVIPVLGNYDETGELANALTYFRENMAQADRLRKELETQLKLKDLMVEQHAVQPPVTAPTPEEESPVLDDQPPPAAKIEEDSRDLVPTESASETLPEPLPESLPGVSPITAISQLVTRTSHDASSAASEAERTETMVTGLDVAAEKIEDIEVLMIGISDQMSLLAVQTALLDDTDDAENLILLDDKRQGGESGKKRPKPGAGQSVGDRVETIHNGTKRAVKSIQQVGARIAEVNDVAKEFAAEASKEALEAANELLRQSEDLRGMLDSLLGKVQPDQTEPAQLSDQSREQSGSEGES